MFAIKRIRPRPSADFGCRGLAKHDRLQIPTRPNLRTRGVQKLVALSDCPDLQRFELMNPTPSAPPGSHPIDPDDSKKLAARERFSRGTRRVRKFGPPGPICPICREIDFANPTGYQRIAGELKLLGLAVSSTTVRKVLRLADVPPAPERGRQPWRSFLRQQAASTLACDFFTIETLALRRIYVLFFISLATRRLDFIACTANPDGVWVTQQARNLAMQLGEHEPQFRVLIHDRDSKFSCAFDEIFRSEGIEVIRTPVRAPNANAFAERWVRTVRSDCLDRILILARRHLEAVLRVYTNQYNEHRPHRALQLAPPDGGNATDESSTRTTAALRRTTSSADWSTNTNEQRDQVCAPYAHTSRLIELGKVASVSASPSAGRASHWRRTGAMTNCSSRLRAGASSRGHVRRASYLAVRVRFAAAAATASEVRSFTPARPRCSSLDGRAARPGSVLSYPIGCRRNARGTQHLPHCCRSDRQSELLELAGDALIAPMRVLARESKDQLPPRPFQRRLPWLGAGICPPPRDELAVPAQHRLQPDRKRGQARRGSRRLRVASSARSARSIGGRPERRRKTASS